MKYSSEGWSDYLRSLGLDFNQTLQMEALLKSVFEDGWITRNRQIAIDTDDFKMKEEWEGSFSHLIIEKAKDDTSKD